MCLTPSGNDMKIQQPNEIPIRRNYLPALKVEYSSSAHQKSFRIQIYRIQVSFLCKVGYIFRTVWIFRVLECFSAFEAMLTCFLEKKVTYDLRRSSCCSSSMLFFFFFVAFIYSQLKTRYNWLFSANYMFNFFINKSFAPLFWGCLWTPTRRTSSSFSRLFCLGSFIVRVEIFWTIVVASSPAFELVVNNSHVCPTCEIFHYWKANVLHLVLSLPLLDTKPDSWSHISLCVLSY